MSKPDAPGGPSLDEVFASIRKGLAQKGSDRKIEPQLPFPPDRRAADARPLPDPAPAAETLSGKLALALDADDAPAPDEDFASLLAAEPAASAPEPARPGAQVPGEGGQGKDPLWFFGRGAAEGGKEAAKSTPEIQLTRPETLRASFPPLFGGGNGAAPAAAAEARPLPNAGQDVPARPQAAEPRPAAPAPTLEPAPPPGNGTAGEAAAAVPAPSAPPAEAAAPAVAAKSAPAAAASGPVPAPAVDGPAMPAKAPADGNGDGAVPPTRGLEHMIAQVLEPVLVRLLDAALPQRIEKIVREEVARALAAERSAPKKP
jgi:hypothetical protein